jgi:hypothetical protein
MPMVCPKCNNSYEAQVECPICRVRLTVRDPRAQAGSGPPAQAEPWQQTPWARIVGGVVVSQGLYFGIEQGLLAANKGLGLAIDPLSVLVRQQVIQCFSLLVGGVLAGAGQRRGFIFGALVGLLSSALFLLVQYLLYKYGGGHEISPVFSFAQPILQTAFGMLGGFVSSLIWKPVEPVTVATPQSLLAPRPVVPARAEPLSWGRILAGIALAVGGTVWANLILGVFAQPGLTDREDKPLVEIETPQQEHLITWEIFAVAMLTGSSLAGATTASGLKQGLCVGLGTGLALLGLYLGGLAGKGTPPQTMLLRVLDFHPFGTDARGQNMNDIVFTVLFTLGLGMAGGWFGGQLFPPVQGKSAPTRRDARKPAFRV